MRAQNNYNKRDIEMLQKEITFDAGQSIGEAVAKLAEDILNNVMTDVNKRMTLIKNEIISSSGEELANQIMPEVEKFIYASFGSRFDYIYNTPVPLANCTIYKHTARVYVNGTIKSLDDKETVTVANSSAIPVPANGSVLFYINTSGLRRYDKGNNITDDVVINNVFVDYNTNDDYGYFGSLNISMNAELGQGIWITLKNVTNADISFSPALLKATGIAVKYGTAKMSSQNYWPQGFNVQWGVENA